VEWLGCSAPRTTNATLGLGARLRITAPLRLGRLVSLPTAREKARDPFPAKRAGPAVPLPGVAFTRDLFGLEAFCAHIHIFLILFWSILHIIKLTPQRLSAEPRNSTSADALTDALEVASRPKFASKEETRPPPVSRGSSPGVKG